MSQQYCARCTKTALSGTIGYRGWINVKISGNGRTNRQLCGDCARELNEWLTKVKRPW